MQPSPGPVTYAPRLLELTLERSDGTRTTRTAALDELVNSLDGQVLHIILPDDEQHYLTGRVRVAPQYNDLAHAQALISASCDPWRYKVAATTVARSDLGTAYKQLSLPNERRPGYPHHHGGAGHHLAVGRQYHRPVRRHLPPGGYLPGRRGQHPQGQGGQRRRHHLRGIPGGEAVMYQITYDHYILYDPRFATAEDKLMITGAGCVSGRRQGRGNVLCPQPDHPYLDRLQRMQGVVSLLDDGVPVYRGRITKDNATYYGSRKITTEGLMACLNDSVMPPFSFPGDVEEDEEYQTAAASGNVVEYFFRWVLARHNAQVSEAQQIKPGVCTVTDSNNYIARSSTEYLPTMEVLTTRLSKSALGGHLLIRYEAEGNYLDYYADLPLTNTQRVEYAANLLDIVSERDGTEIYTSILPVGKDGLTIADIADGDLTDDLVKDGLTVYSRSGVAAYGRINRYVRWDDITVVANLLAKAKASVSSAGLATQESITVQAVDLGWQDSVQHFRVGRMTLLVSTPHGYNAAYALMELQPDILSPGNTRITLGATRQTYTGAQIDTDRETKEDMDRQREEIKSEMREETRQQLDQVTESTMQQITDVQQSLNSIILAALQNYVETGEFGSYKEEMSSKLELLANQLNLTLTTITERIEDVNGDLQSKYSEVTKAFRFTADGLIIGESGNEILLRLDNDVMQFIRNNTPELMLTAAGVEAHQVKVTILIIGNVAFMADGSGDIVVKGVK